MTISKKKLKPRVSFYCDECGIKCSRPDWEYKRTILHFCSPSCSRTNSNRLRTKTPTPAPGEKKNSLTFISTFIGVNKHTYFKCRCDCGQITNLQRNKFGLQKTCNNRINHKGEASGVFRGYRQISRSYWNGAKHGADIRNLKFEITIEQAWELYERQEGRCALSGVPINLSRNHGKKITASLDRIDSSRGYVLDNIQWLHKDVNRLKMDMPDETLIEWCSKIAANQNTLNERMLGYEDVLIKPTMSLLRSRADVNLLCNNSHLIKNCTSIIASNMDTVGTFSVCRELIKYKTLTCLHKHYSAKQYIEFFASLSNEEKKLVFYSTGATDIDLVKLQKVYDAVHIPNICIDIANGYCPVMQDTVAKVRKIVNDHCIIMAGNIATPDMVKQYCDIGVNIVKVGIGPGAACTTRTTTGIGVPQLSAVLMCVEEAKKYQVEICADGGCRSVAHIAISLAAGANFSMIGSLFAGHTESEAPFINNKTLFYGMSSLEAMGKYHGGVAEYRASEGSAYEVENRGPIANTISHMLGGIRSACTYVGAKNLQDFSKLCTFVRVR